MKKPEAKYKVVKVKGRFIWNGRQYNSDNMPDRVAKELLEAGCPHIKATTKSPEKPSGK